MPTCAKCSTSFPNKVVVDGKERNFQRRKLCISCSPFGSHNTKPVIPWARAVSSPPTRTCDLCPSQVRGLNKYCDPCIATGNHLHRKSLDEARTDATRRRHLLRTRPHQCEYPGCGIKEWLGSPVPLEMDHVDGNSDNNTEANLRLLCPNCHALTPTSRAKNRGQGRAFRRQRYAEGKSY